MDQKIFLKMRIRYLLLFLILFDITLKLTKVDSENATSLIQSYLQESDTFNIQYVVIE